MDLTAYRDLWRTPGVMTLMAAALAARLPVLSTMVPLAFLSKDAAGGFDWSGVVAGAYAIGTAIASVLWARLADRRGARRILIVTGTAWAVMMAVTALLPYSWYRALPVAAALAGLFVAPVAATLRASWPRIVQGGRLRVVYALDASITELLFVVGPLLGAVIVSFASPRAGLLACAVSAAATIWWFGLKQRPIVRQQHEEANRLTAKELVLHRHRLPLLIALACMVMGFASMSLGIVALADEHGNRVIAGVLEAVAASGSLLGGLVAGALPGRRDSYVWRRLLAFTVLVAGCVFATGSIVALAILLFASGCLIAPTSAALFERLGVLTPESARTEIFGWMLSGGAIGSAAGSAVAGGLVEAYGVRYAWALMAVLGVVGTLAVLRVPPHRAEEPKLDSEPVAA